MTQIVHVVLVAWAEDAPADVAQQADEAVARYLLPLPGVLAADSGGSVGHEGLEDGFDWGLVVRFADEQALADYLPHPDHRIVGSMLQAGSSRLVVFDVPAR